MATYHFRKTIREKIKSYLLEIDVFNDKNIFFNDPSIVEEFNFPCAFINYSDENNGYPAFGGQSRLQERYLDIGIGLFTKAKNSELLQDKIDELTYKVEYVLAKDRLRTKIDNLVISLNLISTQFDFAETFELNSTSVLLTYRVTYRTLENSPDKSV